MKITVIASLCAIVIVFSLQSSDAVVEGRACAPEPEAGRMQVGEFLAGDHCQIESVGDTDIVHFSGNAGETIVLQATRQDAGAPCIELFDPHGTRIGSPVCGNTARIDATLEATGDYTIHLSEYFNDETVAYGLVLERVVSPSPTAAPLCFGCNLAEEINGVGDFDTYTFQGAPGDTVTAQASRQSGGALCIELFGPNGMHTAHGSPVCGNTARIDETIEQEGIYTIVLSEYFNDETVAYRVDLQCIGNCADLPSPPPEEIITQSMPPCDTGELCIEFTSVPAYGSFDNLQGVVRNAVTPTDSRVCPYIRVEGGWWTKPTMDQACVSVRPDGTWEADITTGGSDEKALEIAAFLLPVAAPNPPPLSGFCALPDELNAFPKASADRTAARRTIFFSGYAWSVKDLFWGPGPNQFSDSTDNVWVDESGNLHLRITQRAGIWFSAEVVSRDTFGYGTYIFSLASRVDQLNENVVLGLFTWDNDACESHSNELDVEFSRFGIPDDPTAQYVVQPFDTCGRFRFDMPEAEYSTHALAWHPNRIHFLSLQGPSLIQSYEFIDMACIPTPVHGNARINLWLNSGIPPSDGQEVEVVITNFLFIPDAN